MASYGTKYRYQYVEANGLTVEVQLQQQGYSGSVTDLSASEQGFEVTWGQQGQQDLTRPLKVSTARLWFEGDANGEAVKEVFDSGDFEWRVRYLVSGSLEWEGFLATELWRSNPNSNADTIELEAIDGLTLLENRQAYDFELPVSSILDNVLRGWTPGQDDSAPFHDLPIVTSQDWRPDGLSLPNIGPDQPFDELIIPDKSYKELDDKGEVEGTLDQRTQLEDILERFGLQLFLARGKWWIRQRDQIEDGSSLKSWEMPTSSSDFNDSSTRDVTADLPHQLRRTEKPKRRVQRLRSLESVQTYDDLGELVLNGSFEEGPDNLEDWTTSDLVRDDGTTNGEVMKFSNTGITGVTETQSDSHLLALRNPEDDSPHPTVYQRLAPVQNAGPNAAYELAFDVAIDGSSFLPSIQIRVEGSSSTWYLKDDRTATRQKIKPAQQGTVPVQQLPGTSGTVVIPAGAELPVYKKLSNAPEKIGSITLEEPAFAGDTSLTADVSTELPQGALVTWWFWTTTEYTLGGHRSLPTDPGLDSARMIPQLLTAPQHTTTGDIVDGELVFEVSLREGEGDSAYDHFSAQLVKDGDPIEETSHIALDDQFGRNLRLEHRIGDGPTDGHPRGIFGSGGTAVFGNWGTGPNPGQTGKGIEQLLAEQWMRQQRETLDRRTFQFEERGAQIGPQYVYSLDGTPYTPTFLRYATSSSGNSGTIEITELKDAGISGLEQAFSMDNQSAGGAGGSGGTIINTGDGGGGGVSSWGELSGKPSGLFSVNGDNDGIPETQTLGKAEIADSLGHSPGLADGIQTFIRDASTNTALVTELGIKSYVDDNVSSVALDLGDDDTIEIESIAQISVRDDTFSVFSVGSTTGELLIDVNKRWPVADTVDGYEGDELAVLSEDETITGQWLHDTRTDFSAEVRHPDWSSGLSHWGIESDGTADFRLLQVDELRAEAFTADVTQSLAGSDVLTKSAADLASNFTVPNANDGFVTNALHIENVGEVGAQAAFEDGDTVRLRVVDRSGGGLEVLDVWGTVQSYTDNGDGTQSWDFETADGTLTSTFGRTIHRGARVLDYGKEGDHLIERSVTDVKSPFDRTVRWFDDDTDGVPDRFETDTQTGRIDSLPDVSTAEPGFFGSVIRLTDDILAGDLTKQDDYLEYLNGDLTVDGRVFMREGIIEESVTIDGTGVWPSQLPGNLISLWTGYTDRDRIQGEIPKGRTGSPDQITPGEEGRVTTNFSNYVRVDRGGAHGNGSLFVSDDDFLNELDDGGFESGNDTQGNRTGLSATTTNRATGSTSVIQTDEARSGDHAVEMVKDFDSSGSDPGSTENTITYDLTDLPSSASDYAGTIAVKPTDLSSIDTLELDISMDEDSTTLQFEVDRGEWQVLPFLMDTGEGQNETEATLTVTWPGSDDNVGRLLVDEMAIYPDRAINTTAEVGAPFDAGTEGPPSTLIYPVDLKGDFTVGMHLLEWTGTDGGGGIQLSGPDSTTDFMTISKNAGSQWELDTAVGAGETKDVADFPEPDDEFHEYWVFMTREGDTITGKAFLSDGQVVELSASGSEVSEMDFDEVLPAAAGPASWSAFVDHAMIANEPYSTADCERIVNAGAPLAPGDTGLSTNAPQSGVTIRSDSEPTERQSGNALQEGDLWIDTDDGDKPHTWDGSLWVAAYTQIDGGNLRTGTVNADKIVTDKTLSDQILANQATVSDTLTLGDGNGNGKLVNPGGDYEVSENGIDLLVGSGDGNELGFWDNGIQTGTKIGFIRGFSQQFQFTATNDTDFDFQANDGTIRLFAGKKEIELAAGGGSAFVQKIDSGLALVMNQGFEDTDSPPDPVVDNIAIYAKEDSSGVTRLFYADENGNEHGPL